MLNRKASLLPVAKMQVSDQSQASALRQQAKSAFAYTCRHYLNVSSEEFIFRYDSGRYDDDIRSGEPAVTKVVAMLPFAR